LRISSTQANARVHHNKLLALNFWLLIRELRRTRRIIPREFLFQHAGIRDGSPIQSGRALCAPCRSIFYSRYSKRTSLRRRRNILRDVFSGTRTRVLLVRLSRDKPARPLFLGVPRPCMVHARANRPTSEQNHPPVGREQISAHWSVTLCTLLFATRQLSLAR
jgi:hypothetical protein